jgi:hypothetical protein
VARTALRTKLREGLADQLTDIVVDALLTIRKPDQPLDLHMVRLQQQRGRGGGASRGLPAAEGGVHGSRIAACKHVALRVPLLLRMRQ